ncbi:MAG: peroxiredoxin, partial [Terriglobales bacterium]
PKDQTQGCTIEAHNFQRDQPQYADRHAVVLGVSVDTVESHKAFCAKEGLNFKMLADTEHKVVKEYGSTMHYKGMEIAARNTFIVDPQGKIVRVYTNVDPNKHSAQVLAALDELEKGAK